MAKSSARKFPVFSSLTSRRVREQDLTLLLALFPRILDSVSRGSSIREALADASPTKINEHYALLLDISAGEISLTASSSSTSSANTAELLAALRKLERRLRSLIRELPRRPLAASPFSKLETLL